MRINHRGLWLSLLWIIVGGVCFGIGVMTEAHVATLLGMIILPSGILYTLLAGYPSRPAPPP
ncbi:MAG TPA: hypothetical protein VII06_30360 [Chloroflexota bacterium]|jgi:hypothetical protein